MPTTTVLTERLALEGPLPLAVALAIVVALLWLFARSLRREQDVIGRRNVWLFWTLRAAALAVAVWMLLAPSTIRSQRSTTRQSVAFVVDTSLSMQTVDPDEPAEDTRWALAAGTDADESLTISIDRALAAARMAERRLESALAALQDQQDERSAMQYASEADGALGRTREHLQAAQSSASAGATPEIKHESAEIARMLDTADYRSLAALAAAFEQGREAAQGTWREGLVDIRRQTAAVSRRLVDLAHRAAIGEVNSNAQASAVNIAEVRPWSRLQRISRVMDRLDAAVLPTIRDQADIRIGVFDSGFTLLPIQSDTPIRLARTSSEDAVVAAGSGDLGEDEPLPSTDIADALQRVRRMQDEQPLAAVFLLTDAGHNHPDAADPRQAAAELAGIPVYTVPIGNTRRVRDVELKSVSAPSVVMKDDDVIIEATVGAYDCEGELLHVELLSAGSVIQQRDLQVESPTALLRARFNARLADVGTQTFQIRVQPLEGELSEENNFEQFEINVTRNEIRVLLADGSPRWEYRYLAHLFRRDAGIECDELLFQPRRTADEGSQWLDAMPTDVDEWSRYDVVLIGDVSPEQFPIEAQRGLVDFVQQRGGTAVIIAGDEAMPAAFAGGPLEELLPVTAAETSGREQPPEGYAFHVTEDGWSHHALMIADTEASTRIAWDFINRHSPLYRLSEYRRAKPTARTLIAAVPRGSDATVEPSDHALLTWQPAGRGRSVFLGSPETFRMRYLRGDRLHYRFWGQLLRWAIAGDLGTGSELIRIRTDRPDYRSGDVVEVALRLQQESGAAVTEAEVEAVAIHADAADRAIPLAADPDEPGRYRGTFADLPSGIYRVEPRGSAVDELLQTFSRDDEPVPAASFTVRRPLNLELLDTRSDRALAEQISETTGGQVLPPTAIAEVLEMLDLQPIVEESVERLPLWVRWEYLWIVFGCLVSEWIVRKHKGLS